MTETRKLAAILAADVVGYSPLAGIDEEGTVSRLRALSAELIDPVNELLQADIFAADGDQLAFRHDIIREAVRGSLLILRSPSLWYLLGIHFHQAWLKFRWAFADARLELSEIWEQAKADWKRTFS